MNHATWLVLLVVALALPAAVVAGVREEGKFLGTASCSATSCHGSLTPRQVTRVTQDEYRTWLGLTGKTDKHARAYKVLSEPLGQRIARWLGYGDATTAPRCLACHEPPPPPGRAGAQWTKGDAVGCEDCHGAASAWRDSHANTPKGAAATHADNVGLGMIDTKDLAVRAAQCLKCHLGTADRRVDHELIAAGHPDLPFELDTFTGQMPPHWKLEQNPLWHVRAWAVGQAVALQSQFDYVVETSKQGRWPDYARLDCAACHHPLQRPELQWRLDQEKVNRGQPGIPPFNPASYLVYRHLVRLVAPKHDRDLERAFSGVSATMNALAPGRGAAALAATRGSQVAGDLARRVESVDFDPGLVQALLRSITKDGDAIADGGPRAALQAVWALDCLIRVPHASQDNGGAWPADVKSLIDEMYHHVDDLSHYSAPRFATQMKRFASFVEQIPFIRSRHH